MITGICIDDQKRAYFANHLPIDLVRPLYTAMMTLFDIMYEGQIQFKLEEGKYIINICMHINDIPVLQIIIITIYDIPLIADILIFAGDMVSFHNDRVFHARSAFQVTGRGERYLTGGYIEWDEMKSRRRVLQKDLAM